MRTTFVLLSTLLLSSYISAQQSSPDACTINPAYEGFFSNNLISYDVQTYCAEVLGQSASTVCVATQTSRTTVYPAATITGVVTVATTVPASTQTVTMTAVVPQLHAAFQAQSAPQTMAPSIKHRNRVVRQAITTTPTVASIDYSALVYSVCFCGSAIGDWQPVTEDQICTMTSTVTNKVLSRQDRTVYTTITAGVTFSTDTASVTSVVSPQTAGYIPDQEDDGFWNQWYNQEISTSSETTPVSAITQSSTTTTSIAASSSYDPQEPESDFWQEWAAEYSQFVSAESSSSTSVEAAMTSSTQDVTISDSVSLSMTDSPLSTAISTPSQEYEVSAGGFWQEWEVQPSETFTSQTSATGITTSFTSSTTVAPMLISSSTTAEPMTTSENPYPNIWEEWASYEAALSSSTIYEDVIATSSASLNYTTTTSSYTTDPATTTTDEGYGFWQEWASDIAAAAGASTTSSILDDSVSAYTTSSVMQDAVFESEPTQWQLWTDPAQNQTSTTSAISQSSVEAVMDQNATDYWYEWYPVSSTDPVTATQTSSVEASTTVDSAQQTGLAFWQAWEAAYSSYEANMTVTATRTNTATETVYNNATTPTAMPTYENGAEWFAWEAQYTSQSMTMTLDAAYNNATTITLTAYSTVTVFETVSATPSTVTVTVTAPGRKMKGGLRHGRKQGAYGGWAGW